MKHLLIASFIIITFSLHANPVSGLLERIDTGLSKKFELIINKSSTSEDYFELYSRNGKICVKSNNYASMGAGINWYLKYVASVHVSWNCMKPELPETLPAINSPIRRTTKQTVRYQFNYCTYGYSMPFWDWNRWEQEIDWLVLHGINTPLAFVGIEAVWYNVLCKLGYTSEEIGDFVAGPAFLPWWGMNNLEGWGGPLPLSWYAGQEQLQKKILERMRDFGMNPVLPGYAGMMPSNVKEKLGYNVTNPGKWGGFKRPAFLQPTDTNFTKVAQLYYKELDKLYGKTKYYSMDPFHEGGNIDGVDLDKAGRMIVRELKRNNSKAIWVVQSWQKNPRPQMIDSLNQGDMLVLDLWSECRPQWGDENSLAFRPQGFGKHDWLFCCLLNFGNNVGLYGRMDRVTTGFDLARNHIKGKTLKGIGMTMEGIENNPVMFELFFEMPWYEGKINIKEWVTNYANYRYGQQNGNIEKAWAILSKTAYNCPTIQEGTSESIFCARPDTDVTRVSCCSFVDLYYDPNELEKAAKLLLNEGSNRSLMNNDNYMYDLTDVVRQCLTNKGLTFYHNMMTSYKQRNIKDFEHNKKLFLNLLLDQDKLLSTRKEFMLGTWLQYAKNKTHNENDARLYEWNARLIITTWGDRICADEAGLRDYSHREWSGMLKDFYYPRWKMYLDMLSNYISGKGDLMKIDFYKWEEKWTRKRNHYPITPSGNELSVANEMAKKYLNN